MIATWLLAATLQLAPPMLPPPLRGPASAESTARVVRTSQVPDGDPWFGVDKVKHFFTSAFVQSVTYGALRATNVDHRSSMYGATAATALLGIGKELRDWRGGRGFSARDLVWDAGGAAAASLLLDRARR